MTTTFISKNGDKVSVDRFMQGPILTAVFLLRGVNMPRKTATIKIHHVFGTRSTIYSGVYYRAKHLFYKMENENINVMLEKAKTWAFSNGFTHIRIEE